jgi:hypothetical protein
MAHLYMVLRASCWSPQFSFADFVSVCISVVQFFDVETICSLKFNLLSIVIPRYFILLTSPRGFLFRYIYIYLCIYIYYRFSIFFFL